MTNRTKEELKEFEVYGVRNMNESINDVLLYIPKEFYKEYVDMVIKELENKQYIILKTTPLYVMYQNIHTNYIYFDSVSHRSVLNGNKLVTIHDYSSKSFKQMSTRFKNYIISDYLTAFHEQFGYLLYLEIQGYKKVTDMMVRKFDRMLANLPKELVDNCKTVYTNKSFIWLMIPNKNGNVDFICMMTNGIFFYGKLDSFYKDKNYFGILKALSGTQFYEHRINNKVTADFLTTRPYGKELLKYHYMTTDLRRRL